MKNLLAAIGLIAIIGVAAGVLVGVWVFRNVDAKLLLSNQPAKVIIPEPLRVSANVLNNLEIELDTSITTTVPTARGPAGPRGVFQPGRPAPRRRRGRCRRRDSWHMPCGCADVSG